MHPIGFSTGALAKGDFERGLKLQRSHPRIQAIELSALRDNELEPLVAKAKALDLQGLDYVSVHAPSKLKSLAEETVVNLLKCLPADWPLVVHPDVMQTPALWRALGSRLCIENMDNRKTLGKNVAELRALFREYPDASFCLDVGHARQIDPTMAGALHMLTEFGTRLRQIHVSDVGAKGEHLPVRALASWAYERIARHVPQTCPLIIESVIQADEMARELETVSKAFRHRAGRASEVAASALRVQA